MTGMNRTVEVYYFRPGISGQSKAEQSRTIPVGQNVLNNLDSGSGDGLRQMFLLDQVKLRALTFFQLSDNEFNAFGE